MKKANMLTRDNLLFLITIFRRESIRRKKHTGMLSADNRVRILLYLFPLKKSHTVYQYYL